MSISVVIHTFNSGKYIRQCLESVKEFDEIIVCDMYSKDDTLSIVKEYGATIVMYEPCGIPEPARTFAICQATKEWVLVVDSDEIIPGTLKNHLYRIIASENCPNALYLPRKNFFMGRFIRSSFPDYQLRFFRKKTFKWWPGVVHSQPEIEGKISKAPQKESLAIIHQEENGIKDLISKMNRYTDLELDKRKEKRENIAGLLFKPFFRFFVTYFIKGSFRDGKEGLIYAMMQAYYKFIMNAKIIERQKQSPNQSGLGK